MKERIIQCCRRLRLSSQLAQEASAESPHQAYVLELLETEVKRREAGKQSKLIKEANFYTPRSLEGFCFDEINLPDKLDIRKLTDLDFLETKTNIVMYGNVGTGKTHLSIALGMKACQRGHHVRFYRTTTLVNSLSQAKKSGTLPALLKALEKADLLILDEWGYVPLDRTGAQLLFEVVSQCYEKNPLIINTNLEFSRWGSILYDEQMTGAIIDRLMHHCHLLTFPGPSYRMRQAGLI